MNFHGDQQVKSFFLGQYLASGLKITFGILVPSLAFTWADRLDYGLIVSLGAFYVSLSDHPGPVMHRRNAMLATIFLIFLTVILTGLINNYVWLLGVEIFVFCFLFSMLTIYGARASAVGTAVLLMMISSIHISHTGISLPYYSLLILGGGIWYLLLSLSLNQMRPYRQAQQLLGEGVLEVAKYIRLKGNFYDDRVPVDTLYKRLIIQQVVVNKNLDNVRQIILRTRNKVRETMKSGRLVMMIFIDVVESFEMAMSTHQDYTQLRTKYAGNTVLSDFSNLIQKIAVEYEDLGYALINNQKPRPLRSLESELKKLKDKIDLLEAQGLSVLALKKTLVNARNMTLLLEDMYNYFNSEKLTFLSKTEEADLTKFISHQDFDWKTFKSNLSLRSSVFRYSVRLAVSCLVGYLIIISLPRGEHSYWILVTILVIQRPDFALSKKRNYQRIIGSVIGGLVGAAILYWIHNDIVRFIILIFFMILGFSFNRVKYMISVVFMTALTLVLFSLIAETDNIDLSAQRVIYTILGSGIAFLGSYFILPTWESSQMKELMSNTLKANLRYFTTIIARFANEPFPATAHKLARKDILVETAILGNAFQNMLDEPKSKRKNLPHINEFVVLNHILSSYLASLASDLEDAAAPLQMSSAHQKLIKKTRFLLQEAIGHLDTPFQVDLKLPDENSIVSNDELPAALLVERQLRLIKKVAADLEKLTRTQVVMPTDQDIDQST